MKNQIMKNQLGKCENEVLYVGLTRRIKNFPCSPSTIWPSRHLKKSQLCQSRQSSGLLRTEGGTE
jgi:hypothetical protein